MLIEVTGDAATSDASALEAPLPTVVPTPLVVDAGPAQMHTLALPLERRPAPCAFRVHALPTLRPLARVIVVDLA